MGQTQQKAGPGSRPVVLILGGGYGGVALAKLLDESNQCFVLLVDQKEFFHHKVATPRALAQKHYAHSLLIPYDNLLRNGVVICGVVSSISPQSVSLHGRVAPLLFDFLVIATGAKYSFPFQLQERRVRPPALQDESAGPSRGNDSKAAGVDGSNESDESAGVPQPLLMMDTLAQYSEMHERVAAARRILIIGGGCVGIETAGELAAKYLSPPPACQSQNRIATAVPPANIPGVRGSVAPASPTPPSVPSQPPAPQKEIVLVHSRAELMNRQTGMRDKMRTMALSHLRSLGVQVVLQERVDLESIREVRNDKDATAAAEGVKSDRSGECSRLLQSQGYLSAAPGCSLVLSTIKPTPPVDPSSSEFVSIDEMHAAPAFQLGGPQAADLVLLCTGVRHDASLFEADSELRNCVDSRGRLVVNQFLQLEGSVSVEKAVLSALAASDGTSLAHGAPAPGADSPLHSKFSFHYPHVFALGDCCVPLSELAHSINPQAYHAHRHAQTVARNILNMISGYALKPWEGAGALSLFLSVGPQRGVSQLPNSQHALAGDSFTRLMKSADMHVAANWAFLNQDPARPSFKGHTSAAFTPKSKSALRRNDDGDSFEDPTSPVAAHPLDSMAMSAQAKKVEAKMVAMGGGFSPSARLLTVVAPALPPAATQPPPTAAAAASASASADSSHSSTAPASQWSIQPARPNPFVQVAVPPATSLPSSSSSSATAPAPISAPVAGAALPSASFAGASKGVSVVVEEEEDEEESDASSASPPARHALFSPSASSPMGPILMAGPQEDGFEAAMRAGRDVMDTVDEADELPTEERAQEEERAQDSQQALAQTAQEDSDPNETAHDNDAPSDLAIADEHMQGQLRSLALSDHSSKESSSRPSSPPAAPHSNPDADLDASGSAPVADLEVVLLSPAANRASRDEKGDDNSNTKQQQLDEEELDEQAQHGDESNRLSS